jgi:hypothetical protein
MKFLFTYPDIQPVHPWEGAAYVERMRVLFDGSPDQRGHEWVDDPVAAEMIIFLEPNNWKDRSYAECLLHNDYISHFPQKCFVFNYAPFYIDFLPGLYANIDRARGLQPTRSSWCYLWGLPNEVVQRFAAQSLPYQPQCLFSFRGSRTHPVRQVLFEKARDWQSFAKMMEIPQERFYRNSTEDKQLYAEDILNSAFVLCPRGLGTNSHRIYETMALGRVPVILSDNWTLPDGPDWQSFSLRLPEVDAPHLAEILKARQSDAAEMGRRARIAWLTWFADETRIPRFLDRMQQLLSAASEHPTPDYRKWWRSWRFYAAFGMAPHQKLLRHWCRGSLLRKIWHQFSS